MSESHFFNRILKRYEPLSNWARRWPTDAWRLYDRDMPEYPWSVDLYADRALITLYPYRRKRVSRSQSDEVVGAVRDVSGFSASKIHLAERRPQSSAGQYGARQERGDVFEVREGDLRFGVELGRTIDSGLFLDHRALRREIGERVEAIARSGRTPRFLNLFSYTGAFTVWAASRGAHTTSVDLSRRYTEQTERNLERNGVRPDDHIVRASDVLWWLPREAKLGRSYDLIVLDPPTASRSKKMAREFHVQRDHAELVRQARRLLAPGGTLFFSTNYKAFELDEGLKQLTPDEITERTRSRDFRPGAHRCWEFRRGEADA